MSVLEGGVAPGSWEGDDVIAEVCGIAAAFAHVAVVAEGRLSSRPARAKIFRAMAFLLRRFFFLLIFLLFFLFPTLSKLMFRWKGGF